MLACHELTKTYGHGPTAEHAVQRVSLALRPGECCALLGPSGSGKTSLLSMLGGLLTPTSGKLRIDGQEVSFCSTSALSSLRRRKIGFVFQHAQLLPFLNVRDNLRLVAENSGLSSASTRERIGGLAERLGLGALLGRKPNELSGGQRQRAAVARAVLHRPPIVLADEPTAALDWENGQNVVRLLVEYARQESTMLLVVTHDTRLIRHFDRVLNMESGRILASDAAGVQAEPPL